MLSDPVFLASTTSKAGGPYSVPVAIPAGTTLGAHQVVVSGGGASATTSVTVAEPATKAVARTGADGGGLLRVAAMAVGACGLLLLLGAGDRPPARPRPV